MKVFLKMNLIIYVCVAHVFKNIDTGDQTWRKLILTLMEFMMVACRVFFSKVYNKMQLYIHEFFFTDFFIFVFILVELNHFLEGSRHISMNSKYYIQVSHVLVYV